MTKYIFVLCAVITVATSGITPHDFIDMVKDELQILKSIVQVEINTAYPKLDDPYLEFQVLANNTGKEGEIALQRKHGSIITQLNNIKDLAKSANVDISPCTNNSESAINALPAQYITDMRGCVDEGTYSSYVLHKSAKGTVDKTMNEVSKLEGDVEWCVSRSCLEEVLDKIELNKLRLPGLIEDEVIKFQANLSALKISVEKCVNDKNSQYDIEANSILNEISTCVDKLLG